MATSRTVVLAALFANGAIAILKFIGYLLTGSPSMLSETYHSISDTANQVFLLIGIRYGKRQATRRHPFGYGKAQFFFAFLVSVLLFGIAGWESARHGYEALVHGETSFSAARVSLPGGSVPAVWVNYAVLIGGIGFESYAFKKAYTAMAADIRQHDWAGFREAFRKTSDVTTLTALTEDTVALAGLVFALVGIALTQVTGNPVYDAGAALLIGILLMAFALALAWENKRLLMGESLPRSEEQRLRDLVSAQAGVTEVVDFRTVYFGPDQILLVADVAFDAELDAQDIDDRIAEIETIVTDGYHGVVRVYIEPLARLKRDESH